MLSTLRFPKHFGVISALSAFVLLAAGAAMVAGKNDADQPDFCVKTKVFVDGSPAASSSNTTIFSDGMVFDFPESSSEVTVADVVARQIVILDTSRKVRTQVSFDQLQTFGTWLSDLVRSQNDPLLRFCAEPAFEITRRTATPEIQAGSQLFEMHFSSPLMTYEVAVKQPTRAETAQQYRQFSDWYARLNSLLNPHALPPFARMFVNEKLAAERVLPRQVRLRLAPHPRFGGKEFELRSDHTYEHRLSHSEAGLVQVTRQQLAEFRPVTLDEYRRGR